MAKKTAEPAAAPTLRLHWVGEGNACVPGYPMHDLFARDEAEQALLIGTGLYVACVPAAPAPVEPEAAPASEAPAAPADSIPTPTEPAA